MSEPTELPSPVDSAKVDAWIKAQLAKKSQTARQLERAIPAGLAGESALKTVAAALYSLRERGAARLQNGKHALAPGVKL